MRNSSVNRIAQQLYSWVSSVLRATAAGYFKDVRQVEGKSEPAKRESSGRQESSAMTALAEKAMKNV